MKHRHSAFRTRQNFSLLSITNLHIVTIIFAVLSQIEITYARKGSKNGIAGSQSGSRTPRCPIAAELNPCTCRVMNKGMLDVVCDNADEKHIKNALDSLKKDSFKIYWLKLRSCKLPRVQDYIFLGLDVQHLNIIRSNVSVIDRSSLSALGGTLTDLDLSANNIHDIPTAAFSQLKTLNFLNLNYNKITSIKARAFEGLVMLERLSMYENQISKLSAQAFKGIGRRLSRLNLGKNKLKEIPTHTFDPLQNLFVLDLNENQIQHLPDGGFAGLHKLDMLKLEHNQITTVQDGVFKDLKVLNSLNIEHNKIVNISERAFEGLEDYLGWLELGHNRLDHIPSHALRPLHNLRQLDLDANMIQNVSEDAFRGFGDTLKYLLIDKNHITNIPPLTFIDLHSLEWIKLSHNELTTLTEDTVQPILDTLTHIDVSNNPLQCDCEIYWLYLWLIDPENSDNVLSTDAHKCTTPDRKSHMIKHLEDNYFDCERSSSAHPSFEIPILSGNENGESNHTSQPRQNNSDREISKSVGTPNKEPSVGSGGNPWHFATIWVAILKIFGMMLV